jgi:hypothetical protein
MAFLFLNSPFTEMAACDALPGEAVCDYADGDFLDSWTAISVIGFQCFRMVFKTPVTVHGAGGNACAGLADAERDREAAVARMDT